MGHSCSCCKRSSSRPRAAPASGRGALSNGGFVHTEREGEGGVEGEGDAGDVADIPVGVNASDVELRIRPPSAATGAAVSADTRVLSSNQIVQCLFDSPADARDGAGGDDDEDDAVLSFKAGDRMVVIKPYEDWLLVRRMSTGEEGYVPFNFVAIEEETKPLNANEWYHEKIPRKTAEQLLLDHDNEKGVFLVRESDNSPGAYALSILSTEPGSPQTRCVKHYRLKGSGNDGEGFYLERATRKYDSLEAFVEGYTSDWSGLCCQLTRPCMKQKPTIYDLSKRTQKNWEISKDQFELIEKIGEGFFAEVWKGQWKGRKDVAIKKLKETGNMPAHVFLAEAAVMKKLRHDKLVALFAVCTQNPIYIVTELLRESLQCFLRRQPQLPDIDVIDYAKQIAEGMAYMERQNFIHRDLAARNILMVNDTLLKIADFGLSKALGDESIYGSKKGAKLPLKWTAPEGANKAQFSIKSDVWSYGIVLVELTTRGGPPYPNLKGQDVVSKLGTGYRHSQPPNCSDYLYEIMLRCWEFDPSDRPTFEHLHTEMASQLTEMLDDGE